MSASAPRVTDPADAARKMRRWLIDDGRFIEGTGAFDQAFVDKLLELGFPLERFTTGLPSLHPQVDSFSTLWEVGKGMSFREFRRVEAIDRQLAGSPILAIYQNAAMVRHRLEGPAPEGEYHLLSDMRAEGFTDYVGLPVTFSDGSIKALTYSTKVSGGFSDAEIDALTWICDDFGLIIETRYLRHLAGTLMNTYVGPVAGRRVLDGNIKRGMGETIRAAIWFCDLKGFTSLSELLPESQTLELLNDYFDVVTSAIEEQDGEILKFIGDAVLAIFMPEGDDGDEEAAVVRALNAAQNCVQRLGDRNAERKAARKMEIGMGIALHFGDVHYGNVGGEKRLDLTVIGPAVNLASRIEGLTRDLKRQILVSSEFAALHPDSFEALGEHAFKGIGEKRAVYAPR